MNGCLPELVLDLITLQCTPLRQVRDPSQVETLNLEFEVSESIVALDLNRDGDMKDHVLVAPIIWAKGFRGDAERVYRFAGDFVQREPKHAFDFFGGIDPEQSWRDGRYVDRDNLGNIGSDAQGNSPTIVSPEGIGSGDNQIDSTLEQYPVWILTAAGRVFNLLPAARY